MNIILPSFLFPPCDYFSIIKKNKEFQIELHESFPKQTLRNRFFTLGNNNEIIRLTIPIIDYPNHTKTIDIKILHDNKWKKHFCRTLQTYYAKTPYYLYYSDEIFTAIYNPNKFLYEYNMICLETILKILKMDYSCKFTNDFISSEIANSKFFKAKSPTDGYLGLSKPYHQMYSNNFISGLSIIDMVFNIGPDALLYL